MAEVETDKASIAFEAQDDFYIAKFLVDAGAEIKVGEPIMITVEDKNNVGAFGTFKLDSKPAEPSKPSEQPKAAEAPKPPPSPVKEAPKTSTPPPPAPPKSEEKKIESKPAPSLKPSSSTSVATHWGEGVKKSPIYKKLLQDQQEYLKKFR